LNFSPRSKLSVSSERTSIRRMGFNRTSLISSTNRDSPQTTVTSG